MEKVARIRAKALILHYFLWILVGFSCPLLGSTGGNGGRRTSPFHAGFKRLSIKIPARIPAKKRMPAERFATLPACYNPLRQDSGMVHNPFTSKEVGIGVPVVKAQQPRHPHRYAVFSFPELRGAWLHFWRAVRGTRKSAPVP